MSNALTTPKRTGYRGIVLILLIMLTVAGSSVIFATYTLRHAAESMENNLQITLSADAATKAAEVSLWLERIEMDTKRFVNKDMLRLFCSEYLVYNQQLASGKIPTWALQDGAGELDLESTKEALQQQLLAFMREEEDVVDAGIWDTELKPLFLSSEHISTLTPLQDGVMRKTLLTKEKAYSVIYDSPNGLMINLAYPIYPPEYSDLPPGDPVGVALLFIPLETVVAKILQNDINTESPFRLMQWTEDSEELLQFIDLNGGNLTYLAGWLTDKNTPLPLEKRLLTNSTEVYSLGVPLEGYDLLMAYEKPAYLAEEFYNNFKIIMYSMVGASIFLTFLVGAMGWWFLVRRNEQDITKSMRLLYEDVNTKQQILNGINATLVDGVVLTDSLGNIQYANASFAKMVKHDIESLYGYKMGNVMNPEAAERLQGQLERVVRTEQTHTFEEKIVIHGELFFLQAVCTPYFGAQNRVDGVVSVYRDVTQMLLEREKEQARVEQLIQVLTMAIELVNPYLCGHSQALGDLANKLAINLKCSSEELKTLRISAALSQIGMLSLPQELLNKKGALSDEERALMNTHVEKTCAILADFDFGLPVQATIRQMYENMDGSGYPDHLQGDDIAFLPRILAVSNVFCAILRPRVYRKAKTLKETLMLLDKDKQMFDPKVIAALHAYSATEEGKAFIAQLQRKNVHS